MSKWQCFDCGKTFDRFQVIHDSVRSWDGSYDDQYVCPYCGSENTYLLKGNEVQIKEIEAI